MSVAKIVAIITHNIEKRKSGPFGIELIIWLQNKINGKLDR